MPPSPAQPQWAGPQPPPAPATGYPPPQPPSPWSAPPGYPPQPAPPPRNPWGLTPRFIAAVVAGGLVVGVAVALPIALIGRNTSQPGTNSTGGGSASASGTPAPAGAGTQARLLYQQALSGTRAAKGVHYVAVTSGPASQHTTGDAGVGDGTQDISVTSTYGAEQFTLRLVNGVVFFQGNAPAAEDQLGVSPSGAASIAGKWVSVVRGDGPYTVLEPGITTADQAAEMPMVAASLESVTTSGGRKATRIHGSVPPTANVPAGTATMDVDPSTHLPISYTSTISAGSVTLTATTLFSNWGTAPAPTPPSGAVAWSTLNATEPPGGYGSGGGGQGTPAPA